MPLHDFLTLVYDIARVYWPGLSVKPSAFLSMPIVFVLHGSSSAASLAAAVPLTAGDTASCLLPTAYFKRHAEIGLRPAEERSMYFFRLAAGLSSKQL